MNWWIVSTIAATAVAFGLVIRLMIEDERNRKLELRMDLLTRARWKTTELYNDEYHVLPIGDIRDHWENVSCWCIPEVEPGEGAAVIVIHNSADGRECMERALDEHLH